MALYVGMSDDAFVGYVGDPSLHDGRITDVREASGQLQVMVQSESGALLIVTFTGVRSVVSNRSVGMVLYSLSEISTSGPGRQFVFANWDEEDDAKLEVQADGFTVSRIPNASAGV